MSFGKFALPDSTPVAMRANDLKAQRSAFPRCRYTRVFAEQDAFRRWRAQGKPGADRTRGPRATKSTGVGPQVQPETRRPSLRSGLQLIRALPGDRALLPPSLRGCRHPRNLAPASGRQDHATSPYALRALTSRAHRVHRISPQRSWRSRAAPPSRETGRLKPLICPTG